MKIDQKIPEGWSVKKLGEIGTFVSGGTPDTEKPEYWNGNIVWLTPSEITKLKTRFVSDSERKITKLGLKNSSAVLLPKNSLIICTRATIGDCCINTKEVSTNQGFKNLIPNNNCTDFLYYLISIHKSDLIRRACGSTFLEISKHDIEKLKYVFPPLAEQEKIAEILSCWDEGIEKLSALIEKKKIQKKALMQQLLTAKIRLPGFTDPWNVKKLGEISLLFSGGTPSKEEPLYWTNGHIKWLSARYIEDNKVIGCDYITEEGLEKSSAKLTYANDIILVTRVSVGKIYFCKESYAVNQDLTVIRSKNVNSKFLFFLIKNKQALILEKSQGLAIKGITKEELSNMSFPIPPLAEQEKIADILSKADEEIELLNKKLEAFKLGKKALMQKLLTGQIRVKVN